MLVAHCSCAALRPECELAVPSEDALPMLSLPFRAGTGVLAAALITSVAGAQVRDSSARDTAAFHLNGVIVQASRPVARSGGASAIEVKLDSLHLAPAPTLQGALRDMPFIQVRTNPKGEGYFANRGSGFDAREVAVIIDGVPTTLNFDDRSDLSVLPVAGAKTLTLVRGLPSLLFGPNVLGGVVELGVASGALTGGESRESTLSAGVDGAGQRATSAKVAIPVHTGHGTLNLRSGLGYRRSDGFPLPGGVHEPAPFAGDDHRLNSDLEMGDAFAAARYESNGGSWMSASSLAYSGRRATPAELTATSPQLLRAPLLQRSFSVLSIGTGERPSPLGGRAALQLGVGYDFARTKLDGFTSRSYATLKNQEDDVDRNSNARVVARQTIAGSGELTAAFTWADVTRHESLTPGTISDYEQKLWSAATELGWQLPAFAGLSAVRATIGGASDGSNTPKTGGKPSVTPVTTWGGRAGVTAASSSGNVLWHAGLSRRARFPALREMYSGALTMIEPNPDLRPELLVATEVGATARIGNAQVQAVGFHNDITDAIVRSTVAKKVKRVNRDETVGSGLELLASMPFLRAVLTADLTAQSIAAKNPVAGTDYQSEYMPKFAGGLRVVTPLTWATTLDLGARAVGSQYCVNATSGYDRLAPSTMTRAEVRRTWASVFETSVGVDNLTNSAVYDQCGLPQPGRVARLQFMVR